MLKLAKNMFNKAMVINTSGFALAISTQAAEFVRANLVTVVQELSVRETVFGVDIKLKLNEQEVNLSYHGDYIIVWKE